jgi:membrane-associated protease RseP (regulator of RpoE activity)
MRRVIIGLAMLLVTASGAAAQEKEMTEQQRRELEQKLEQLRLEMREVERQLGRAHREMVFVAPGALESPMTLGLALAVGRPRLGVIVKTDRDPATDSIGAVLEAVTPEGPAAKAGLQSGDIVVTFNGQRLVVSGGSPGERLIDLAGEMEEGDTVRIAIRRGKEAKTVTVVPKKVDDLAYTYRYQMADSAVDRARRAFERSMVVAPRVELRGERPEAMVWSIRESARWSDMELTTLDTELGSYFGTTEGLLVVRAPRDSLLGLKSGDVILRIGGRVPSSPSHAIRILRSYEPGDEIRIEVMRNKRQTEVKAVVPQPERGMFWEEK